MPKIQGAEILDALSKIKEPATFNEILRYVASGYDEPSSPKRIEQLVQAALAAGVRYGFVQKHRDLYYAIKDAQKALDEDADGTDEEDDEIDDIDIDNENENENEEGDSAASAESICSCVDHTLVVPSPPNKMPKDGVSSPSKAKDPSHRESRHDARILKKHESKHNADKKKGGAVARQTDEDERNYGDMEEEDDDNYSDEGGKHASTCPRDCAACAARKRAAAARRRKRKGRSRSRSRRRRY